MFEEIWDFIVDGFTDFKDAIGETFEGIGEISYYGLGFGAVGVLILIITGKWMLGSFTSYMKPASALIITIITYAVTFIVGYFIGKRFEDT